MEFDQVIQMRRSIRKFKQDPVPGESITELLEAARLAPSGLNLQPWRFIIVKNEAMRSNLANATPSTMIAKAPLIIVCCADNTVFDTTGSRVKEMQENGAFADTPFQGYDAGDFLKNKNINKAWIKHHTAFYTAIAIDHMILKATDLGLGSCWIGAFDQEKVRKITSIDARYDIVALLAIGYPETVPGPRPRLALKELILKKID
jgi:nitroreductase